MSDLAKWDVHGPAHTLRTEFAEWDLGLEQWQTSPTFHFGAVPSRRKNERQREPQSRWVRLPIQLCVRLSGPTAIGRVPDER